MIIFLAFLCVLFLSLFYWYLIVGNILWSSVFLSLLGGTALILLYVFFDGWKNY